MKHLVISLFLLFSYINSDAQNFLFQTKSKVRVEFAHDTSIKITSQGKLNEDGNTYIEYFESKTNIGRSYYFDKNDICTLYIASFEIKTLPELVKRLNTHYTKTDDSTWINEANTYIVEIKKIKSSIMAIYKPL